ncbi:MAG: hypothetical protein M0C28_07625 [Candidatus Moduliflexus flocculans]|nr:hypothetical protein [Candidatus Moduliflexus flocculans]
MSTQTGVCNFCGTGCGHLLEVGDGAVRGVFASPGHPVSRGRLCVRGWHIHELLATRDRITAPAIRRDAPASRPFPTKRRSAPPPSGYPVTPATRSPSWPRRAPRTRTTT